MAQYPRRAKHDESNRDRCGNRGVPADSIHLPAFVLGNPLGCQYRFLIWGVLLSVYDKSCNSSSGASDILSENHPDVCVPYFSFTRGPFVCCPVSIYIPLSAVKFTSPSLREMLFRNSRFTNTATALSHLRQNRHWRRNVWDVSVTNCSQTGMWKKRRRLILYANSSALLADKSRQTRLCIDCSPLTESGANQVTFFFINISDNVSVKSPATLNPDKSTE